METVLVFYGDVVRDEFSGVDVSRCDSMKVVVTDMVNREFLDVRRCIRAQFGREMRGKKMTVEALIVVGGNDGTPARWGLREVKSDRNWGTYMRFASTPGAAMYGRPMVYVKFISASDDVGSSRSAAKE